MDEKEISLVDLFNAVLKKIWLVIILFFLGGAIAFGYSKLLVAPQYSSSVNMYVKATSESNSNIASSSDLTFAKSLVNTYIVILKDTTVVEQITQELSSRFSTEELSECFSVNENGVISSSEFKACLNMSSVEGTEVLNVTAITANPQVSAEICKIYSEQAPELLIRVVGAGSVETIGEPKVATSPSSPNVTKNAILGCVVGAVIALAWIFIKYFLDNTVKNGEAISTQYSTPILAEICEFDENNAKKRKKKSNLDKEHKVKTLLNDELPFSVVESFKGLRTNTIYSLSTCKSNILCLTSAITSDGKSTISANMAIGLAQTGSKVLLIDTDLRRSVQHHFFNVKNENGLSNVISKMTDLDSAINKNVAENLDLITAGPKPPNPSELLASEQMKDILKELKEKYDYIIIDAPPINIVSDALGFADMIAGYILVVSYGITKNEELSNIVNKVKLADSNVLGVILNKIPFKDSRYSKYKYKYNYSYDEKTN